MTDEEADLELNAAETSSTSRSRSRSTRRTARLVGLAVGAVIGLCVVVLLFRDRNLSRLALSDIEAAMERWQERNVKDYKLIVQLQGRMANRFELQVQAGRVVSATRDGAALPPERITQTWSINGAFETMLRDAELNEMAQRGDQRGRFVKMLGSFDAEYGIPLRYLRIEMSKGGNTQAGWDILEFTSTTHGGASP